MERRFLIQSNLNTKHIKFLPALFSKWLTFKRLLLPRISMKLHMQTKRREIAFKKVHNYRHPTDIRLTVSSPEFSPRMGVTLPRISCSAEFLSFSRFFFFLGGSLSLDTKPSESLAAAVAFNSGDWAPLAGKFSKPSFSSSPVPPGEDLSPFELAPKYFRFRGLPGPLFTGVDLPLPSSPLTGERNEHSV